MKHLNDQEIALYRTRALGPADLLRVSDHLQECEPCRQRISEEAVLAASASTLHERLRAEAAAFSHLSYGQIAAYVDRIASDSENERVSRHLRDCQSCADDVRNLRTLRAELSQSPAPRPHWLTLLWPAFALAAAAACLVLVVLTNRPHPTAPVAKIEPPRQQQQPAPSPAGTVIADGSHPITISPDGAVAGLETLPAGLRESVQHALSSQRLETSSALSALSANRDVLLGAPAPAQGTRLIEPVGVVVESQTPAFRWKPVAGAEYQVSVYTGDFLQAAASPWIREPQWMPATPLARGTRYSWQVTVRQGGSEFTSPAPPEPEAKFQVLDAASASDLARLRSDWRDAHLVLGVACARAGLIDEARRELRTAADQNPGSPAIAALLESLNSGQRRSK